MHTDRGETVAELVERNQRETCARLGRAFTPPRADQLVVLSDGVFDGDPVEGVRYPSPDHMSGWWITTGRYSGDIRSLTTVHMHHVAHRRPDIAALMALPHGYRFRLGSEDDGVWFDAKVAQDS